MEKAIRILYLEDVPSDAELILHELSRSGMHFTHTIVETKKDYIEGLISLTPDLVISDYSLPQFDGMNALSLRNEIAPHTPFILVTGSVNEEVAVECIKAGADDYILKSNLSRLIPSLKAAFTKRDAILLQLNSESVLRSRIEPVKTYNQYLSKLNKPDTLSAETHLVGYEHLEEKLTLLDMAIKSAGIGTWVFDLAGDRKYFDNKASQLLGFPVAKYKRSEKEFLDCIHAGDRNAVKIILADVIRKKTDFETDFRVLWPDGTVKFLTSRAKIIINDKGIPVRLNGLIWDITDQKLLQITLQENIRKTNSIINNLNGAVFRCRFDDDMTLEYISEGIKELTGYPSWDFLMNRVRSFASIIYPEDKESVMSSIHNAMKAKSAFSVEFRIISAKGEIRWISERGRGVFAGDKIIAHEGFLSDITNKKHSEEELKSSLNQLHELTQYIQKVREDERVAISRELHDDLGQALTAVKIDLATIKQNISDDNTVIKINKVSALVSDTIKTVQRLTAQLRPQIIDDLGIEAAFEWYTKEYAQRNKVEIILKIDPGIDITPDASLIIFRIMQEALTNISRHSGATRVDIGLIRSGDNYNLRISDNGTGISNDAMQSKKSFGLISMRERAASLNGTFEIFRENNCSTVVNLIFPITQVSYANFNL